MYTQTRRGATCRGAAWDQSAATKRVILLPRALAPLGRLQVCRHWPKESGLAGGSETTRRSLVSRRSSEGRATGPLAVHRSVTYVFAAKAALGIMTCRRYMVTGKIVEAEVD